MKNTGASSIVFYNTSITSIVGTGNTSIGNITILVIPVL
jgi:archaellum component FlaG (FlaF/FlaG flagellin family)